MDEATALAFARGELGSDAVAALTEHIDVCEECRALVALAASGHVGSPTGEAGAVGDSTAPVISSPATVPHSAGAVHLTRGTAVDRFTIITSIGRGAMGEVYAAYDPGLNRKVALKFLNADVGSLDDPRARLLREARAMATVSHPNVVAVHDIGVHDGHPYIAMAFIEGTTLRGWCDSATRSVAEILLVYRRAAAGLAAAHAQGMVHRDFKPDNVLVGVDNRVYVTDFGLVSGVADPQPSDPQLAESPEAELGQTRRGVLVGTPAYMAPEQLRGERADARSDQFSFCVSLWEALSGHRPYGGATLVALLAAIEHGGFGPQGIPRWLLPTLVAGLSGDASGRHASMDVLIARLQRRRTTMGLLVVAGVVATGLAWSGFNGGQPSDPCSDSRRFLDDIWDGGRRASLEEVFASSDVPFVVQGKSQTFLALDDYASRWAVAHRGACRAAHRADTSRGLGALACLDRRLLDINALVDVLHRGDSVAMEHALGAVERLDNVESCLEAVPLELALPDGTTAEQVAGVRRGLADVHAHVRTRLLDRALPIARTALDDATELGYAPLTAEASRALGQVQQGLGRLNVAEPLLEEAVWLAQAADHQAEQFAASLLLVSLIGEAQRPKDAMRWARYAQAQLDRHGGTATQRSNLANARGWVLQDDERYEDARAAFELALSLVEEAGLGRTQAAVVALNNLGSVAQSLGQPKTSIELHQRAIDVATTSLGADHPIVAISRRNQAVAMMYDGQLKAAVVIYQDLLQWTEQTFGLVNRRVAQAAADLGMAYMMQGKLEEAYEGMRRAADIRLEVMPGEPGAAEAVLDVATTLAALRRTEEAIAQFEVGMAMLTDSSPADTRAGALGNYGLLLATQQDYAGAIDHLEQALAIREGYQGPDHPEIARVLSNLGGVLLANDELLRANGVLSRAVGILESAEGGEQSVLITVLATLGRVHLASGEAKTALPLLERAVALGDDSEADPITRADAEFGLARALADTGGPIARARALATVARAHYARAQSEGQPGTESPLAALDQWRSDNPAP